MRFTLDRCIAGKALVPLATTFGIGLAFLPADRVMGLLSQRRIRSLYEWIRNLVAERLWFGLTAAGYADRGRARR